VLDVSLSITNTHSKDVSLFGFCMQETGKHRESW